MSYLNLRFVNQIVRHVLCYYVQKKRILNKTMSAMNTLQSFCLFIATHVTKHQHVYT